jgi:serine phosphatase RsbU (regulator of sigma subunit)
MSLPPVVDVQRLLDAVENAPPVDAVQVMAEELARTLDARSVAILVVDLRGRQLARLSDLTNSPDAHDDAARSSGSDRSQPIGLPIGGDYENVLRSQTVHVASAESGWLVLVPVSERGEAVGILEMVLPQEPDPTIITYVRSLAHLLAFMVIANRRHTDLFEWGQRGAPLTLSAEVQRRLLPSAFTVEAGPLTVAGWLEPAMSVAGDTFDYSLDRDLLHLSLTDAMGHGVQSALLATLVVGSTRNSRRRGLDLVATAREANAAITEFASGEGSFTTGLLLRVELASGAVDIVNAGHVPPFLLRHGEFRPADLPVDVPFCVSDDGEYTVSRMALEPGDRLVLLTDGMLERNASRVDVAEAIRQGRPQHPREAVRDLADAVVVAAGGQLQDDATALFLDWHGPDERRVSRAGTNGSS